MLRPTPQALEHLDDVRAPPATSTSAPRTCAARAASAILELRNPRHLNAEDDDDAAPRPRSPSTSSLLDPEIEVGVFRGGVVEHPRYAGRRIFGAGINLTHLYRGQISYLFFSSATSATSTSSTAGSQPRVAARRARADAEKLWIAAAETYAIGGACQLLHVMDHVIAERGAACSCPRARRGSSPAPRNLRLPRSVGDRLARQAILSGREFVAGAPDGDLLCDEIVEPGEMDAAIERARRALTSSGLVNAAANRRALRVGAGAARRLPRATWRSTRASRPSATSARR